MAPYHVTNFSPHRSQTFKSPHAPQSTYCKIAEDDEKEFPTMDPQSVRLSPGIRHSRNGMETEETVSSAKAPTPHPTESSRTLVPSENSQPKAGEKRQRDPRNRKDKRGDLGRKKYNNSSLEKRERISEQQEAKRRRIEKGESELPVYATTYSKEEIENDVRKPKRKVAVMVGYNGGGYKGMQLDHKQKTIEGDLFRAFVQAGAISKANAEDPKKSSFVRCARTDKGVHAAGNVVSLKLIVEDPDIVSKINGHLPSQIRVWGIERTKNSFSCYQLCDSRVYEYLIPSYSFLPPHPKSFLGRQTGGIAAEENDLHNWKSRQAEVEGFWERVDEEDIKPLLMKLDERQRELVEIALFPSNENLEQFRRAEARAKENESTVNEESKAFGESEIESSKVSEPRLESLSPEAGTEPGQAVESIDEEKSASSSNPRQTCSDPSSDKPSEILQTTVKTLRSAYISAKRNYRIDSSRLERVQKTVDLYKGTRNFHNYTIEKQHSDPSAKRIIKSCTVDPNPVLINGTEWLSLKVHGQSFMMHQIRKMVSMVALIVRCGCDPNRILQSYGPDKYIIPKAPSLGLLLERPVFDSYNERCKEYGRDPITFSSFEHEMQSFKQEQIYNKIYQDEEAKNTFSNFFNHLDNYQRKVFLFITSRGLEATQGELGGDEADKEGSPAAVGLDPEDGGPQSDTQQGEN